MYMHRTATVSTLALIAAAAAPAYAQDASSVPAAVPGATQEATPQSQALPGDPQVATAEQDIVVTGVRASLASAQGIKRNATAIVDSIVAQDIGKLPDNTVSDALQRVTGVQVTRGSGEAGTVLIRGLPNIATLINGRESFTGTQRGISLQDLPAELVAGVDVYKTTTPDIIEGGLSGTVDVRLRRPFDFSGLQVAGGGRAVYSDQSGKWGYLGSGLVSDRWTTGIGEVGAMVGVSYNKRQYRDDTAFDFVSNPITPATATTPASPAIPDTVGGTYASGERTRLAVNGSLQWKPTDNLELYADGIYTRYRNTHDVSFFIGLPKATAVGGTVVTSTYPGNPELASGTHSTNAFTLTSKQAYQDQTETYQADFGTKWTTGPAVLSTELTYNYSKLPNRSVIVDTSFNAPTLDVNFDNNGTPLIKVGGVDLTNPANFSLATLFDNHSVATSKQWAWRGDLLYTFDDSVLTNFKIGARFTDRQADSQATASQGLGIKNPPLVSAVPGFGTLSPNGLVQGASGIGQFVDADTGFLLNNTNTVRTLFSQPTGDRAYDPSLAFFDHEKTYAFYGQLGYGFDIGSMHVSGVGGLRVVNTAEQLTGFGVSAKANYLDILPSFNAKVGLTNNLQLRLAFAKTLTRPEFAQLNPLVSYTTTGNTGNQSVFYVGAGGNPALQPIKSTAYDVSLEYYPARSTSITAAGFYKDLSGYIQTYSRTETYLGRPALVSRPRNTGPGKLYGAEVAYQQFFDFLPGALSGFGTQLNGTYIFGTTQDPIFGGQQRLVNVSKYSFNAVAIYEKYGISGRLAYNWRSNFVDSYTSGGSQASSILVAPTGQLDFSGSYALTKNFTITFDATNITDRVYHDRFAGLNQSGIYSSTPRDTRTYDRTFEVGGRFRF
ncbi:TonB-dependent receptor [Sphingomonas populi]|uniref:TonB-dependent receptor n=1 Tax=Sphingomonas populi TaxID=2484750 RepID=A0A4Q6Y2P8_9SPHN|nr:TonB-dependent receptor [Sphingomonas populi]RZF63547.1 TonB-dependent receptor [Sphingomonas populi]